MNSIETDIQSVESDPNYDVRRAIYYAKVMLEKTFVSGAAVSAKGIVQYPFPEVDGSYSLSPEQEARFNSGEIIVVRPNQINVYTAARKSPRVFLIPPGSLQRLAVINTSRRAPSVVLVRGHNEDGKPITQDITGLACELLMQGLRSETLRATESAGIDIHRKGFPEPTTIVKTALSQMAHDSGYREINER